MPDAPVVIPPEVFAPWRNAQRARFLCSLALRVPELASLPAAVPLCEAYNAGKALRTPNRRVQLLVDALCLQQQSQHRALLGTVLETVYQLPARIMWLDLEQNRNGRAGERRLPEAWLAASICNYLQKNKLLPRSAITDTWAEVGLGYDAPADARAAVSAALLGGCFDAIPGLCAPWPWIRLSKRERKKRAQALRRQGKTR